MVAWRSVVHVLTIGAAVGLALGVRMVGYLAPAGAQAIPKSLEEGGTDSDVKWRKNLAIPKDAPDPESAYAFMNYIMTPQVIADISNFKRYANANTASQALVLPAVKDDPGIYPPPDQRRSLAVQLADSPDQTRAITRVWQKFKTGQ